MHDEPSDRKRSFQFSICTMLVVTVALAILLGILKWAGAPPMAIAVVVGMIALGLLFAVLLVLSLTDTR